MDVVLYRFTMRLFTCNRHAPNSHGALSFAILFSRSRRTIQSQKHAARWHSFENAGSMGVFFSHDVSDTCSMVVV